MNNKVMPVLEKALQDKVKGNFQKAHRRITEALDSHPGEIELYLEAADVCLEGGESLQATQFLKRAYKKFDTDGHRIDSFALEKLQSLADPVLGKFLLESAIKRRSLDWAEQVLEELQDREIRELLQRTRTKKQTLTSAVKGGYALKSEMVVNALSEALLCLRLGRIKAAVQSLIEILDDAPAENEVLVPFLEELERKYPETGRIRYAYACALMYAKQYDKAMSRLVQGVQLEPKIADEALGRLRDVTDKMETPPAWAQDAQIELLLAKGDVAGAGELLQGSSPASPGQLKRAMELLGPYVQQVSDPPVLHFHYIDAALATDETRRALRQMEMLRRSDQHRDQLYQWLEHRSSETPLPPEVMILQGELALESHRTSRAVEIFEAVFARSPNDARSVLAILAKHKDDDEKLARLFDEQTEKMRADTPGRADDGMEFEHFENSEFTLSSELTESFQIETGAQPTVVPTGDAARRLVDPLELEPPAFAAPSGGGQPAAGSADADETESAPVAEPKPAAEATTRRASVDIVWEEEDADGVVEDGGGKEPPSRWEAEEEPLTEVGSTPTKAAEPTGTAQDIPPSQEATGAKGPNAERSPDDPARETDATRVAKLAESLKLTGARLFFHIEQEPAAKAAGEPPEADEDPPGGDAVEPHVERDIEVYPPESVPMPSLPEPSDAFSQQFERFLDGELDNTAIIALTAEALERGNNDEARELLHFTPANENEALARKRHLADYYLAVDQPSTALEIIGSLELHSTSDDVRRQVLLKQATCYKKLNDFEGARAIHEKIAEEISSAGSDSKAKRNDEHVRNILSGDALVLERTTSVHDD